MLEKILTKPLELNIDGKVITFKSMDDLEFALSARTLIPQGRIFDAINSTLGDLDLESNSILVAIEQISELIEKSSGKGDVTQKLKAINSVVFSNDNHWRDIFSSLKKDRSSDSSNYKLTALTAYLQYLNNRKEMVQSVKARLEKTSSQNNNPEPAEFRTGELDIDDKFDSKVLAKQLGMTKLPTAEYTVIELEEDEEVSLLLANYKCRLVRKDSGIKFIDHESETYPMIIGLNKIGRGRECHVRFTDTIQRISRLHLMVINHDNKKLELTDLSTYGTYYLSKSS
jgi:FHA domain